MTKVEVISLDFLYLQCLEGLVCITFGFTLIYAISSSRCTTPYLDKYSMISSIFGKGRGSVFGTDPDIFSRHQPVQFRL